MQHAKCTGRPGAAPSQLALAVGPPDSDRSGEKVQQTSRLSDSGSRDSADFRGYDRGQGGLGPAQPAWLC